jgi:hypothetical protein
MIELNRETDKTEKIVNSKNQFYTQSEAGF